MKFIKPKRKVNKIFLHCSAFDKPSHDNIAIITKWHTDKKPRGRGWRYVGYHFFIRKDGTIEEGRNLELIPAAQKGYNTGSIAICLSGLSKEKFTQNQFDSLKELCQQISNAYKVTFHGHNEVNNIKTCPVFNYKQILNLDNQGYLTP